MIIHEGLVLPAGLGSYQLLYHSGRPCRADAESYYRPHFTDEPREVGRPFQVALTSLSPRLEPVGGTKAHPWARGSASWPVPSWGG